MKKKTKDKKKLIFRKNKISRAKNSRSAKSYSPYKCSECGNSKSFIFQKGKKETSVTFYGLQKDGSYLCVPDDPNYPEPDYIICAECSTQVD